MNEVVRLLDEAINKLLQAINTAAKADELPAVRGYAERLHGLVQLRTEAVRYYRKQPAKKEPE